MSGTSKHARDDKEETDALRNRYKGDHGSFLLLGLKGYWNGLLDNELLVFRRKSFGLYTKCHPVPVPEFVA